METIAHHGGLGIARYFARRMAKKAGATLAMEDQAVSRKLADISGDRVPCAPGVKVELGEIAGQSAIYFTPENPRPGTLLFFHGGGYITGSAQSHKPFVSKLSQVLNMKAISANYRLAPEDICPAAAEDCEKTLRVVRESEDGPLILAGDSAGGGVSLAALLRHRDAGRRMPEAVYLISPWVDLTGAGESMKTEADHDPMITPHGIKGASALYVGDGDNRSRDASPLFADLSGLPPILIQVGEHEVLRDDSVRLAEKLKEYGVEHRAELWSAMFHDFQLFYPIISEARTAIKDAAAWLETHL